ncbi:hypothetical protein B0T10DRAFT_523109 [Thelonectria olida]|uniref:Uncharacterized protein n=1 Tax=Thelonectria olida TaxID=1576542 RepID=A0A9P8VP98_9HYPO|nr:hypothetical protein B0T10DRAFT_523109 [Thelonectria olida]
MNDWSSDDDIEIDPQLDNHSQLESQPTRSRNVPSQSQRRPAQSVLPFVPYDDWVPDQSYIEHPPSCIRYVLEWKFTFNNRSIAKQTEEGLVVAPSDFWDEELSAKIEEIAKSTSKPCRADSTTVVMSVNDRSEPDITKRFNKLQIDWSIVERQLQAWSPLLRIGKRLKINVAFKYVESGKTAATAAQLAEREVRLLMRENIIARWGL